jgi:hypothetical protein
MKTFFGSSAFAGARTVERLELLEAKLYCDSTLGETFGGDPYPARPAVSKREQAKLEASLNFLNQRKNGQARRALDRMYSTRVARSAAVAPPAPARARRGVAVRSSAASGDSPSSDDDSSDGEPPRPRICISQLYSYQSAAVILDCSVQTLYNQVNIGRIPAPLKTAVGPRFSQEQLAQIVAGVRPEPAVAPVPAPAKKKVGRPRLYVATTASSAGKVGAA